MNINTQINAYRQPREIKQHDQELLDLMLENHSDFRGRLLDIGCATGGLSG
jgi:2-polyprenyl-3-methyl-5-hydroxy-6-metoxy-1,4-benzoquinol methylase